MRRMRKWLGLAAAVALLGCGGGGSAGAGGAVNFAGAYSGTYVATGDFSGQVSSGAATGTVQQNHAASFTFAGTYAGTIGYAVPGGTWDGSFGSGSAAFRVNGGQLLTSDATGSIVHNSDGTFTVLTTCRNEAINDTIHFNFTLTKQ
jgi:hypothetical protein